MYSRLSGRLLALATGALLPSCASNQGSGEIAIPSASESSPSVATAAPPATALPLPPKEPRDAAWEVPGGVCMPAWATNAKDVGEKAEGSRACGPAPGDWVWDSKFARRHSYFSFDTDLSRSQTATRGDSCCYRAQIHHVMKGRPLEGEGGPILATTRPGAGWSRTRRASNEEHDVLLAAAWRADALEEHASIAAFAALALDLLALGAPASLVAAAHGAAQDEVRHAELCFAVAARFGASVEPSALALPPLGYAPGGAAPALLSGSRLELVRRSAAGGCVGEGLAALEAYEAARACEDADIRHILETIADDEARHAELAVRVIVWAIETASPAERAALRAELSRPRALATQPLGEGAARDPRVGRLTPDERARCHERALREVALPTLAALAALASMAVAVEPEVRA